MIMNFQLLVAVVSVAIMACAPSTVVAAPKPSASAADAGCYGSGQHGDCSAVVTEFCNGIAGVVFPHDTEISKCYNMNGYSCNLKIANFGGGGATFGVQQCINDQLATNNGCHGQGGVRDDGNWELTLDPNTAAC